MLERAAETAVVEAELACSSAPPRSLWWRRSWHARAHAEIAMVDADLPCSSHRALPTKRGGEEESHRQRRLRAMTSVPSVTALTVTCSWVIDLYHLLVLREEEARTVDLSNARWRRQRLPIRWNLGDEARASGPHPSAPGACRATTSPRLSAVRRPDLTRRSGEEKGMGGLRRGWVG
jgi:hypothetical protein